MTGGPSKTTSHDALQWCTEHRAVLRWLVVDDRLHLRLGVPTGEDSAAVAIVSVEDVTDALASAVEQVRSEIAALDRRARMALA